MMNNVPKLTSTILTSFSSPVKVSTSSYFRFCARLSSYSRATSVRLLTSGFASLPEAESQPSDDFAAAAAFCITLENKRPSPHVDVDDSVLSAAVVESAFKFS